MLRKSIIVHIGTHKTGTTSLQKVLLAERSMLKKIGAQYYHGLYIPQNHVELHIAAMRPNRASPFKIKAGISVDQKLRDKIFEHVRHFVTTCQNSQIIFSAEGLSFLRHPDEIEWLASLFEGHSTNIVVYLRSKAEYLRSYRAMMIRHNFAPSSDPESFAYTADDSWLLDYSALTEAYGKVFGSASLIVMNYEREIGYHGGTVGSFLSFLGVDEVDRLRIGEPQMNVSPC